MKKYYLLILLLVFLSKVNAQTFVYIPDPAFRALIDSLIPGSIVGTDMNTSSVSIILSLDIYDPAIQDLTGIQYFVNLQVLSCSAQGVNYIPAFPPNLSYINFGGCPLVAVPSLPAQLQTLHLDFCMLSNLPAFPPNLTSITIDNNYLTSLPALPAFLSNLSCSNNLLTSLPVLPQGLQYFSCTNNTPSNPNTFLPALPNSLQNLYASGNNIYCLPNIPNNGNFNSDITLIVCQPRGTPDTWYALKSMPGGLVKELATSFAIGNKGYVSCGNNNIISNDLWEFDPVANTWTQKANLPGVARIAPFSFSAGTKGYLGCGQSSGGSYALNDFYEYDPTTNTWTQKANYPGIVYYGMGSFVVNDKGYVAGGFANFSNPLHNELYKYNPTTNTWTQKTAITGYGRTDISCFAIGTKGYLCGGDYQNGLFASCYAYDVNTDAWSTIASLPVPLNEYAAFAINGRGYIVAGQPSYWNFGGSKKVYEYDPATNYWYTKAEIPGTDRRRTTGFKINGKGYVTTGLVYNGQTGNYNRSGDIFEYTPATCLPTITTISPGGPTTFCTGGSVTLTASPSVGLTYQWYNNSGLISGATNSNYIATGSGNYAVVSTNPGGCSFTSTAVIVISGVYPAIITPAGTTTVCSGASVNFQVNSCTNCSYQWYKSGAAIVGATGSSYSTSQPGNYSAKVTTPTACTGSTSTSTISNININPVIYVSGSPVVCSGDSVQLSFYGGVGATYQWQNNGSPIPGATQYIYYAKTSGNYTIAVTNSCGIFTSPAQAITVNPLPGASITTSGAVTFCSGANVVMNAPVSTNKTYQWKKNGTAISGAVSSSYTAATSGTYKVTVTNSVTGCFKTSSTGIGVTVYSNPTPSVTPQGPTTFCNGDSVELKANYNSSYVYQWKKNNVNISGAISHKYEVKTAGNYKVKETNTNGCTSLSSAITVSVPCREGEYNLNDNNNFSAEVYPNPSSSDFILRMENAFSDSFSVRFFDLIGKEVFPGIEKISDSEFRIRNLKQGIYSAIIKDQTTTIYLKLIKINQ